MIFVQVNMFSFFKVKLAQADDRQGRVGQAAVLRIVASPGECWQNEVIYTYNFINKETTFCLI